MGHQLFSLTIRYADPLESRQGAACCGWPQGEYTGWKGVGWHCNSTGSTCVCAAGKYISGTLSRTPLEQSCFGGSRPPGARGVHRDTDYKELRDAAPRATRHSDTLVLVCVRSHTVLLVAAGFQHSYQFFSKQSLKALGK